MKSEIVEGRFQNPIEYVTVSILVCDQDQKDFSRGAKGLDAAESCDTTDRAIFLRFDEDRPGYAGPLFLETGSNPFHDRESF
jgi:hypothetical protein